jgi:glycosyltransferase involved in cell wall biosynthesis
MISVVALTDRRAHVFQALETACEVDLVNHSGRGAYLLIAADAVRSLRHNRPDVILCKNEGVVGLIAVLLGFLFRTPVVPHIGGDIWTTHWLKLNEAADRRDPKNVMKYIFLLLTARVVFAGAAGVIAVSPEIKRAVVSNTRLRETAVTFVPVPIDVSEWKHDHEGESVADLDHHGASVISTVTNLHHRGKYAAISDALDPIKDILESNPSVEYVVAGDGMYLEQLRSEADAMFANSSARDRLHLPGFVTDIGSLYRQSDLCVYLSYEDGYPNSVIEAQVTATPVVATAIPATELLIDDGETGLLVESPEELPQLVTRLLKDEEERNEIGRRAQKKVERDNSMSRVGEQMVAFLTSAQIVGTTTD